MSSHTIEAARLGATARIARAAARRPWLTLGAWLVALVGAGALAGTVAQYVTPQQVNLVTTEADRADDLDQRHRLAGEGEVYDESLIVTSESHAAGDPEFDAALADALAALAAVDGVSVHEDAPQAVAPNGRSVMVPLTTLADQQVLADAVAAADAVATEAVDVLLFGTESTLLALNELAAEELARSEGFGLLAALVILLVVFGAVVAAGLPLAVALVSITVATGIGAVVARVLDAADIAVSDSMTVFTAMLGLALGIDYSLIAVQRFREELAAGRSVADAVTVTGNTANRAVLFSGATVVVALGGLLLVPVNMFLGIGVGVIAVALASVAAALTLLPAVLRLLGHCVNRLRVPTAHPGQESPWWRRVARAVTRRPAIAAGVGLGMLLLAASPLLGMRFAQPSPEAWPEDFVLHRANDALVEDFGWTESSTVIAVEGADPGAVEALATAVEQDPGFAGTSVDWRGGVAFIDTHDVWTTGDPQARESIERLRQELIPGALAGSETQAHVGGAQAYSMDEIGLMADATPWVVLVILGVSFVLLMVMFRSVVVPLKAIIVNVVGVLATFGAVVAVYQWGWGSALGLPEVEGISPYLPVMTFALVFGLSMDYHVFLLSRIKERYDATGDNRAAVVEGLTRTGPLITGAAAIMVAVFAGFAAASIPELSQWGFALAFGVLLDATVIRVLLVPATMVWLGDANWYLPRWLEWLPRWSVEAPTEPAPAVRGPEQREPVLV